jgi:transposase, IS30 family
MRLCHESIYQAVYQPGSVLLRPAPLAPHQRSPLRTGRDHRRAHQRAGRRRPRFEQPMRTIRQRPFQPADRSQAGHCEGDLIIGKDQASAIGTLVERQTRMVRLLHLPQRDGDSLHDALKARMADLPAALLRSITWDQGTEMARHRTITRSLGAPIYFADPHSPWQRGSNENTVSVGGGSVGVVEPGWCRQLEVTLENTGRLRRRVFRLTCSWGCRHRSGPLVLA